MPQRVIVDRNLGRAADLAASAGNYATATAERDFGLRQQAQAQQAYFQAENQRRYDEDRAQRERAAMAAIGGRADVAGMNNDARLQVAGMGNQTRLDIAGQNNTVRREGFEHADARNLGTIEAGNQRANATLGLGYDRLAQGDKRIEQQAAIAQANREHDDVLEKARATERAAQRALSERRIDQQTYQRAVDQNIREYQQQRRILEQRVRSFQQAGVEPNWGYVGAEEARLGGKIAGQIGAIPPQQQAPAPQMAPQQPAPAPPQQAPGGFDNQSYGMPGPDQEALDAMTAVAAQVAQEMPTASREAKRLEIKSRLMQMGVDPRSLGVR